MKFQPSVSVIVVDRMQQAGGHWNIAYDFVNLHFHSDVYGVESERLEDISLEPQSLYPEDIRSNYHRASKKEILHYYKLVTEKLSTHKNVRFFFNAEYVFEGPELFPGRRGEIFARPSAQDKELVHA